MMSGEDGQHGATAPSLLNFAILDEEDLAVMSAHLQHADVALSDMAHLRQTRRFALVVARQDRCAGSTAPLERCQTGLHFECVTHVSHLGLDPLDRTRMLRLIGITFTPTTSPSGVVMLLFENGAVIKLDVECLEAEMHDLAPPAPDVDTRLDAPAMAR